MGMPHQNYNTSTKKVENSLNGVENNLNRVVKNSNKLEDNTIDKKVESNISIDNIMQNVTKRDKILQKRSQENKIKRVKVNFIELNKEFKINILEEQKPRVLTKKKIENKKKVRKSVNFKSYPKYVDVKYKNNNRKADNLIDKLLNAFGFKN